MPAVEKKNKRPFWVAVSIVTVRIEFHVELLSLPEKQRTPILLAALEADGIVNREVAAGNWHPNSRAAIIEAAVFDRAKEVLRKSKQHRRGGDKSTL